MLAESKAVSGVVSGLLAQADVIECRGRIEIGVVVEHRFQRVSLTAEMH